MVEIAIGHKDQASIIVQAVVTEEVKSVKDGDGKDIEEEYNSYPTYVSKIFLHKGEKNKELSNSTKVINGYFNKYFYKKNKENNTNIAYNTIPFPPYCVEPNLQIFVSLASIFCPFIFDMHVKNDTKIIFWLYCFKTMYPNLPNIFDLILNLGFQPEDVIKPMSISQNSFIIKKFLQCFGQEFNSTFECLNMSVPSSNSLQNIDTDFLVFIPFLNFISTSETQSEDKETQYEKTIEVRINSQQVQKTQPQKAQSLQEAEKKMCNKYEFFAGLFNENNKVISVIKHPNKMTQAVNTHEKRFLKFEGEKIEFIEEKNIPKVQRVALFYRLVESNGNSEGIKKYSFDYQVS